MRLGITVGCNCLLCGLAPNLPTLTPLACDGLYSATDDEQRVLHYTKLMTLMACHGASGATPPNELHAGTTELRPHALNDSRPCGRYCKRR